MELSKEKIVFEVIKGRRSVRSFKDEEVPREMLIRILEAGQWAPSPSNVQSWRFIVVQEAKQLGTLRPKRYETLWRDVETDPHR